jgi:hypothetical protein
MKVLQTVNTESIVAEATIDRSRFERSTMPTREARFDAIRWQEGIQPIPNSSMQHAANTCNTCCCGGDDGPMNAQAKPLRLCA